MTSLRDNNEKKNSIPTTTVIKCSIVNVSGVKKEFK